MRISRDDVELHAPNYDERRRSASSLGSSQSGDEHSALLGGSRAGSAHSSKYSLTGIGTAAAAGSAALMARLGRGRRPSNASQSSGASQYSTDSRNVSGNTMERMVGVQRPSPHGTPSRAALGVAGAAAGVAGLTALAADRSSSGGSKVSGARSGSGGTRSGSGTTRGGSGATTRGGSGATHHPGDRSASGGTDAKRSSGRLSSDVGSADLWYNNRQTITASPDEEIAEGEEESPPIPESMATQGSSGQYVTADSGSISSYVSMGTDSTRSIYATQGSASSKSSRGSNRSGRSKASSGSRGSRPGASGRVATTIPEDAAIGGAGALALGASAAAVYHARRSRNNTDESDIAAPRTSAAGSATPPAGIPRTLEAAGPSGDIGEFGTRIFVRQPTGETGSDPNAPATSSIGRPSFSERNTSVGTFGTPVEEDSRASSE
ncbi:hypothetical protein Q8F55_004110 [Vanrija albida]|uniref:Uncharacterized protein n=1 Tax=Vanrija albida TaxID=181172 RepID=A0ABR3Q6M9_9TREE